MESMLFLAVASTCLGPFVGAEKVFYVKPTVSTTGCPSENFPCFSLQYYADHSNFTNNSVFFFLEGEHHLESVVNITGVANLSLIGDSRAQIMCTSHISGFLVREFSRLSIDSIAISGCSGDENASLSLTTGSGMTLHHVTIFNSPVEYDAISIEATDVTGQFVISNCTFMEPEGSKVLVTYSSGIGSSHFHFKNNTLLGGTALVVDICSTHISVLITDSFFNGSEGLNVHFHSLTDNNVLVENCILRGNIEVTTCVTEDKCSDAFVKLTGVVAHSGVFNHECIVSCPILIEHSEFSLSDRNVAITVDNCDCPKTHHKNISLQAILNNVTFMNYNGKDVSALLLSDVAVLIANCTFENNHKSAIHSTGSNMTFEGDNVFRDNSALVGGGIQMQSSSLMYLRPHTYILFENNRVDYVGGAIYFDYTINDPCFFRLDPTSPKDTIEIEFKNNSANVAGSSLYGGMDNCISEDFKTIFNISNSNEEASAIASDPDNVCFCDQNQHRPNCSRGNKSISVLSVPGKEFKIPLAVVGGKFSGVVPGAIRADIGLGYKAKLGDWHQKSQVTSKQSCSDFKYSIKVTEKRTVILQISHDQTFFRAITGDPSKSFLLVTVYLLACPPGFVLPNSTDMHGCECAPVLLKNHVKCDINNKSILRPANSWIGFDARDHGVMFHSNCPIRYCKPGAMPIQQGNNDSQCAPHRTGLLCGRCRVGFSLTLGSPNCVKCSNIYLLLILPLAVVGLLLVAFLFALNLTVTEGSINGLVFYANVIGIGMNQTVLFSGEANFLHMFLAWLNLDLGISVCLFDGLDGYIETWLQFIFPLYLWMIILVIIVLYERIPALANTQGGSNAVKVLATILLLSYTKLQRTVVTVFSFTRLEHADNTVSYVWLHDANVEVFKGKHLYLGIAGVLVLVFLIVPYTLGLAFFQQLQACSNRRCCKWVNRLKPVFDAYAGPYKDRYRFWTGMLLVVRTLLIVLFTFNTEASVDLNLLVISIVSIVLLMAHSNGIYKGWPYNYLESFFYLQLGILAAALAYARHDQNHSNKTIATIANTSIGLTLMVFLAIVAFHLWCRFKQYCWRHAEPVDQDDSSVGERLLDESQ